MTDQQTFETDDTPSISERAQAAIVPPGYWREVRDIIVGTAGREYEEAFLELQKAIEPVIEGDKDNPFTNSKYTSLGALLKDIRPIIAEHGFSIKQFCGAIRGHSEGAKRWHSLPVATKFTHVESLQWEMIICDMPIVSTAHSVASAMTYGKRYGPMAYLGIATLDDDGMATMQSRVDQEQAEEAAKGLVEKIEAIEKEDELKDWVKKNEVGFTLLSEATLAIVRNAYAKRLKAVKNAKGSNTAKGVESLEG